MVLRMFGGLLFLTGALIMAYNFFRTAIGSVPQAPRLPAYVPQMALSGAAEIPAE